MWEMDNIYLSWVQKGSDEFLRGIIIQKNQYFLSMPVPNHRVSRFAVI